MNILSLSIAQQTQDYVDSMYMRLRSPSP